MAVGVTCCLKQQCVTVTRVRASCSHCKLHAYIHCIMLRSVDMTNTSSLAAIVLRISLTRVCTAASTLAAFCSKYSMRDSGTCASCSRCCSAPITIHICIYSAAFSNTRNYADLKCSGLQRDNWLVTETLNGIGFFDTSYNDTSYI
jgi:hypothetical protein